MNNTDPTVAFRRLRMCRLLLCLLALPTMVLAGGKQYPIEGIVTALGTSRETSGGGGNTPVSAQVHRTYTVKTPSRVFVLECPYDMEAISVFVSKECSGKKKIAVNDAIRFRVEKNYAYVLTDPGKDQKLRVVSEAVNDAGNTVPTTSPQP